jgi:hypothetical protein
MAAQTQTMTSLQRRMRWTKRLFWRLRYDHDAGDPSISVDADMTVRGLLPEGVIEGPKGPTGSPATTSPLLRPGSMIMSGDVDYVNQPPAVLQLSELNKATKVLLELENGEALHYAVSSITSYTPIPSRSPPKRRRDGQTDYFRWELQLLLNTRIRRASASSSTPSVWRDNVTLLLYPAV